VTDAFSNVISSNVIGHLSFLVSASLAIRFATNCGKTGGAAGLGAAVVLYKFTILCKCSVRSFILSIDVVLAIVLGAIIVVMVVVVVGVVRVVVAAVGAGAGGGAVLGGVPFLGRFSIVMPVGLVREKGTSLFFNVTLIIGFLYD
jgi:hypothetical protein